MFPNEMTLMSGCFIHNVCRVHDCVCLCRFFFMYLINKDETEHTGQVFPIILSHLFWCVDGSVPNPSERLPDQQHVWSWGLKTQFCYSTHNLVCLSGVVRLENVPGTLLGILSRWRLFPETIRGPAQLKRTDGSLQWRFDTQWIYEVYSCTFSAIRRYFISWTNSKTNWRGGERDVTEETDSSGGRANAARFFRRDPVPYARWRWDGASAGTPQDSRLLCCSVCCFVFSSFGNAPMPQQSYSLYRKISLRKIFHCMFIMQV